MPSTYHRLVSGLALLLALASPGFAGDSTTPELGIRDKTPEVTAFTHARIFVSPDLVLEDATLVLRDGRVAAVGTDVTPPDDAVVHDLTGRTILPGFVEPYAEYGLGSVGPVNVREDRDAPVYEGRRQGPDAWNEAIHSDHRWVERFAPNAEEAEAFWKRGVTVVQSTKMDGIFRGRGFVALLTDELANDAVLRADALHSASFDKGSSQQPYPNSLMGSIALVRQTLLDADWYDTNRRLEGATEINTALAALADYDGPIVFDTDDELTLLRASRISQEMDTPFVYVGSNQEYLYLDPIADLRPTLLLPLDFPDTPEVGSFERALDVSLAELRHWERAPSNPAVLEEAGLDFAFTGHRLGDSDFLDNLRTAIERGLTREKAMAALTTVPARLLGVEKHVGSLDAGKLGNLIIAEGDLLTEDEEIVAVWVAGRPAWENAPLAPVDHTGLWDVAIDGGEFRLNLTEDSGDLAGSLTRGEDKEILNGVEASGRQVTFRTAWGIVGDGGVARFSLAQVGDRLTGTVVLPDGRVESLQLEPVTEEPTADADGALPANEYVDAEATEESADDEFLVSRVTHPPLAFGFEELPVPETVLVRGATIWTSDEAGVLENADLLVVDGRIEAVGPDLEAPDGAHVVDGTGKHVTAGIIDEHSHIAISRGVNEGSHNVTAEVRIGDVVNSDHVGIYRALGGGVTTIQQLHGSANPIGGQAQIIKLRWGHPPEGLKFEGAPPSIKFALGENVKQSNWGSEYRVRYPQSRMGVESIMRDAFVAAREYEGRRQAWNALSERDRASTPRPRRDLQMEALVEILDAERFIHCHSYVQSEILMLMRLAEELGFRVQTFTHILEGYKVADEMADHGAGGSSFSDWWGYKFEVNDAIPHNTCLMHDAGVVTSVNSDDSEMMRRLNQEASKSMLYCGMDPVDAWNLVTINPAKQLLIDDRVGSLTPGKDADFVVWNGDPLSVYSRPEQTWIDGALYFSRERDAELQRRDSEERAALIQKILADEAPSDEEESDDESDNDDPTPEATQEYHCDTMEAH